MASCLPSVHLTREEHSWFAFASTSTMLGAEASSVKSSAQDVISKIGNWAIRHKVVEEGGGDGKSSWDPHPHLAGKRVLLLIEARGLPVAEVCLKPPHQIVMESRAVDRLDKEAVKDCVERLRDVHRHGY